jgi:uncharacterized membrane protein YdcZ (DUF606 family)
MNKFKNSHLWLLIPFAIVILGFMPSYWLRFTDAPWRQHLHGITATLWFVLLIVQPYLVTRGHVRQHRLFGMIALILAGGVALSAYAVIPYNLMNEQLPEVARYGLSFIDLVLVPGFALAVIMAVVNSKNLEDHAKWMISTVFWAVSPGLFRLSFVPLLVLNTPDVGAKSPALLATAGIANIAVLSFLMLRDKRAHPAYLAAALGSLVFFLPMVVGEMQWWRNVADSLFTI